MNAYEFVLALVLLMFVLGVVRYKMGIPARSMREMRCGTTDSDETLRLRDEVKQLQERIKVLERITVEKENSLAKEIESLRDR